MSRQHTKSLALSILLLFVANCAHAEPLKGNIGQAGGPNWQSAWMDITPPRDFRKGEVLQVKVQGRAEWVRVRLLPDGEMPTSPAGLLDSKMRVPAGGVITIKLQRDYPAVKQISVHSGQEAWGEAMNSQNSDAKIVSVDVSK